MNPSPTDRNPESTADQVVPVADYERLTAARRQLGARGARLRGLTHQARVLTGLVAEIEQVLAETPARYASSGATDRRISGPVRSSPSPATRRTTPPQPTP
ncbi:hypothetical protein ACN27F_33480 [Solwaraspora sp. WMMB335]|uniref:hypothetical protein n=1 Tax=Solwaraspora sp. WMMB335 TaxID=3404118 RepID=UPI003B96347B